MKLSAVGIVLWGFVIVAIACAPPADQPPAAKEAAAREADVEALKALEETVVAALKAGAVDLASCAGRLGARQGHLEQR